MKIDHWQHVALVIRAQIDISEGKFDEEDEESTLEENTSNPRQFRNVVLGAKQPSICFLTIELTHSEDPAFRRFRERFCKFLSTVLPEKTYTAWISIFTQDTTVREVISA